MKRLELSLPEFGFIVATRAALAAGLGLLAASALSRRERRLVGMALLGVGAVTTVPAALALRRGLGAASTREASSPHSASTGL